MSDEGWPQLMRGFNSRRAPGFRRAAGRPHRCLFDHFTGRALRETAPGSLILHCEPVSMS